MEQRKKLIELLYDIRRRKDLVDDDCIDDLADELIANGVVVLPCRCGECGHNKENENYRFCEVNQRMIDKYGYCHHAKRKGGDE